MSTDKERLEILLAHLRLNPSELAKSLGYTRTQRIYFVLNERNGISSSLARDICNRYDDIRFDWLLTGEGEMLKGELEKAASNFDKTVREMAKTKTNLINVQVPTPQKITIKPIGGANKSTGMIEKLNLLGYETPKEESGYKVILEDILNRVTSNPLQVAEQITGVKQQPAISEEMVNMITKPLLDRLSHEARRTAELEAKVALMEMSVAK